MSKLILGPYIFFDKGHHVTGAAGSLVPGLHACATTAAAKYGSEEIYISGTTTGASKREKLPSNVYVTAAASGANFTLFSESSVATTPGTNSAAAIVDFFRKKILAGGPAGTQELRIYTGTKPTSPDVMTDLSVYDSSMLIKFIIPAYSSDASVSGFRPLNYSSTSTQPYYDASNTFSGASYMLGVCPTFTNSSNSTAATATWFWYGNVYGGVTDLSDVPFVIGTVGTTASADLVIPDTSIKPNTAYKSYGFKFEIPVVYTI